MVHIGIIGRNQLGEKGFCYVPEKIDIREFNSQLDIVKEKMSKRKKLVSTSMTNPKLWNDDGDYMPTVTVLTRENMKNYLPEAIYYRCLRKIHVEHPQADFLIVKGELAKEVTMMTFSREAPMLCVVNEHGDFGVGTIMRKALLNHGEDFISEIKNKLGGTEQYVFLVTCNWYCYPEGSLPKTIERLCKREGMSFLSLFNSQKNEGFEKNLYKRGEIGNHVMIAEK